MHAATSSDTTGGKAAVTILAAPPRPEARAQPTPAGTAAQEPVAPERGELARERFEVTQEWLRSTPGERYAIQLATVNATELPQLEEFLRKTAAALPVGELYVYSVKIEGQQHYRVAYGSYPTAAKAIEAMAGLPQPLAAYQPYVRSVERMRSQNRQ
jgi:septal ring-binding cell division protein DamX